MSDPPDITLDAAQAAAIIRRQFPEVRADDVVWLGEGCDSRAFSVDGHWVFRFPKRADVERQMMLETRVLPVIGKASPLPLPAFCFHGEPAGDYPYHFVGYPRLEGEPMHLMDARAMPIKRVVSTMGRFLSWLHSFPAADVARLGVEPQDVGVLMEEVRADALGDFHLLRQVAPDAPLERWHEFFSAPPPPAPRQLQPVLVHRDLAAEHILFDPVKQDVTGVIDWSEISLCDPSVDLACFIHWGGTACIEALLETYDLPVDEGILRRARYLAAGRGIGDVAFGLERDRPEYIRIGLHALELCLPVPGPAIT